MGVRGRGVHRDVLRAEVASAFSVGSLWIMRQVSYLVLLVAWATVLRSPALG